MRQLHDLKQVVCDAREQDARPVPVKEAVGQLLHVHEHIPSHVRLDKRAHPVSDHGDKILTHRAKYIGGQHDHHHGEKGLIQAVRQKAPHGPSRNIRKDQVHQRDPDRKRHVDSEGLFVRFYI